jgi:hypothetical protein
MIGFINTAVTSSPNYNYSAVADLHIFQSTVTHALGFSVSTSRLLATDLNTDIITSNHHEVFLLFLLQTLWTLESKNSSGLTPPTYNWLVTTLELALSLNSDLLYIVSTLQTATIYNTRTVKVSLCHTLPISLRYNTHKDFNSHVKSSQADFLYSSSLRTSRGYPFQRTVSSLNRTNSVTYIAK